MHDKPGTGLSRRQLEYELQWMLRQRPSDPAKLIEFLGDVVVTLIDCNNKALQRAVTLDAPVDPPAVS